MSQTITKNDGNVSLYLFDDDVEVNLSATPNATVRNNGANGDFDIGDLNSSNATLWGLVSGWVDPAASMLEAEKSRYEADSSISSTFTDAIQTEIDRIKAL